MKDRLEIKGALIGMIFGDAGLTKDRKNALLHITHCAAQEDYLEWKREVLELLTTTRMWRGNCRCKDKEYPALRLWTKTHPVYTALRARFYHGTRKTFDLHLLKRLTQLGLVYWLLDDGSRGGRDRKSFYLCTDAFNYIEQLSLQKYFHDKWGLIAKITKHSNNWRLRFPVKETIKLEKLFEPFIGQIPDCMMYKVNPLYEAPVVSAGKR